MKASLRLILAAAYGFLASISYVHAAGSTTTSQPMTPYTAPAPLKSPAPKAEAPTYKPPTKEKAPSKPTLPSMAAPFRMPGVVGFQNNRWEGTDYLGFLSPHIGVDVEVLKSETVPTVPDDKVLEARAGELLRKADLVPRADATEGPPLPFLHVLLIVYPVEKDRFVIFGNCRLFEQIQVMRKNFTPAGYWQAITWENEDVTLTSTEQLDSDMKLVTDKLVSAFIERYKLYNPNVGKPPTTDNEPSTQSP